MITMPIINIAGVSIESIISTLYSTKFIIIYCIIFLILLYLYFCLLL